MLSDDEKEIIECMFSAWLDKDMPLYGGLCYQQVIDLMVKLDISPQPIEDRIRHLEHMAEQWKKNETELEKKIVGRDENAT